ncbi:phosphomevalonate kinase isoform X2 [Oreochromis niloticus]|uniref:phosphomevalonate kinase isoform X2 n=1 Tax=Oreochromis niloticus TaxID=8128 RepID=UPI00039461EB|nr:phosphomevalonate kinase isoform X2 [Oreochromis niloticus]CAI5694900.1 unnamed protein product [Mustela putorius furo]
MEDRVSEPSLVLVFSGKRKSGKDYVTELIQKRLGSDVCCILRLSGPLKEQYAQEHGLDLDQLMGPGPYKEQYRADMIRWGESRRRQDPGLFCRLASRGAHQPVWVGGERCAAALGPAVVPGRVSSTDSKCQSSKFRKHQVTEGVELHCRCRRCGVGVRSGQRS